MRKYSIIRLIIGLCSIAVGIFFALNNYRFSFSFRQFAMPESIAIIVIGVIIVLLSLFNLCLKKHTLIKSKIELGFGLILGIVGATITPFVVCFFIVNRCLRSEFAKPLIIVPVIICTVSIYLMIKNIHKVLTEMKKTDTDDLEKTKRSADKLITVLFSIFLFCLVVSAIDLYVSSVDSYGKIGKDTEPKFNVPDLYSMIEHKLTISH